MSELIDQSVAEPLVPVTGNPIEERAGVAGSARSFLSDRCRVLAAGIIAIVWGMLIGESKSAIDITRHEKNALLLSAAMSVLALLLDYGQYLSEYFDARFEWGRLFGVGGEIMLWLKQIVVTVSVVVLLTAAFLIVGTGATSEAQGTETWYIYRGYIWSGTPSEKRESVIYLSAPNPVTLDVRAFEDDIPCKSARTGNKLTLLCESVRFTGDFDPGRSYKGAWNMTSLDLHTGFFEYTFSKVWRKRS